MWVSVGAGASEVTAEAAETVTAEAALACEKTEEAVACSETTAAQAAPSLGNATVAPSPGDANMLPYPASARTAGKKAAVVLAAWALVAPGQWSRRHVALGLTYSHAHGLAYASAPGHPCLRQSLDDSVKKNKKNKS